MDYRKQKNYYKTAYQNGIDIWTHLPNKIQGAKKLIEKLPPGGTILDIGSGRGLITKNLAEMGFKVIGIDFDGDIVEKANREIKNWGLQGKLKFMEADVFDLPFTDTSFDGVCDFGLLENLLQEDWDAYANEINRILRPGGFYLNVSLSRKTKNFFTFSPINSKDGEFDQEGMHYHFFEKEEIKNIFKKNMTLVSDSIEFLEKPRELALLQTLFQKLPKKL
ncbi:MAG TPA: class I SAM-dependent methyltransferase [Candidatus Paceibacterota bacterium]|nr:class I SAM-dependent methyltransferase [Candidatus Paceibacterota bacterium]